MSSEILDCSICFEPLVEGVQKTPCGHLFHKACLSTHLKTQYFIDSENCEDDDDEEYYEELPLDPESRVTQTCPLCRCDIRFLNTPTVKVGDKVSMLYFVEEFVEIVEIIKCDNGVEYWGFKFLSPDRESSDEVYKISKKQAIIL